MLSPLDNRYWHQVKDLDAYFSDFALMKYRIRVEIEWLIALINGGIISVNGNVIDRLKPIHDEFDFIGGFTGVKKNEKQCNHDVKAVEKYIVQKIIEDKEIEDKKIANMVHWGCTSEDINNFAYGLMLQDALSDCMFTIIELLIKKIDDLSEDYKDAAMMSRTHGQPAIPTTMGKELLNYVYRLSDQYEKLKEIEIKVKFNGAVGNFNAHMFALPEVPWEAFTKAFVLTLSSKKVPRINYNPNTTQIEPRDYVAEIFHSFIRINNILLDLSRDMWGYISLGYFGQKAVKGEVGSSTMPHKVNPIHFENAEGNLGFANAIFDHMANKITISRFQRDLSCSTVMRNMGVPFGHSLLAYKSLLTGFDRVDINKNKMFEELEQQWQLLSEPLQMEMRLSGIDDAYDKIKDLTRGKDIDEERFAAMIEATDLPRDKKLKLFKLRPEFYLGKSDGRD